MPAARRFAVLAAAAAALAALAVPAAQAGRTVHQAGGPMEAGAWAQRVCSSVSDWAAYATKRADGIEKLIDPSNLKQARAVLSKFLDDMVAQTDRMVTRIDAAGTPDVKNGPQIRQRLRVLLLKARGLLADARRTAAGVSTTDAKAFAKSATAVGDAIDKSFTALGSSFDQLDKEFPSPALDKAVAAAPACKKL